LTPEEFIDDAPVLFHAAPPPDKAELLDPDQYDDHREYIARQHELWFGEPLSYGRWDDIEWRIGLGERLKAHRMLRLLLDILRGRARSYDEVCAGLEKAPFLRFGEGDDAYRRDALASFVALIAEARSLRETGMDDADGDGPRVGPFLHVSEQLWVREMRRMAASVESRSKLFFSDDEGNDEEARGPAALALVHCRDCGATGWGGTLGRGDRLVNPDLRAFYSAFFKTPEKAVLLFPLDRSADEEIKWPDPRGDLHLLCGSCLTLNKWRRESAENAKASTCATCGKRHLIEVLAPRAATGADGRVKTPIPCPMCGGRGGLNIVGARAVSLTSVVVSQLFSSKFNHDKKLLAFTDSVQDAAHHAGFFTARTYRFTFRAALQQFVDAAGEGMRLSDLPEAFSAYWLARIGHERFIAAFLAPNMEWFEDYERFKRTGTLEPGSRLLADVKRRVSWEIFSEYGFNARIGRTLEKTGCSTVGADPEIFEEVALNLHETLTNEIGELRGLDILDARRFLLGIITRLRHQGGVFHEGLRRYVEEGGNTYVVTKHIHWMPNFGVHGRAPLFLSDGRRGGRFDAVFGGGSQYRTRHQDWVLRCLERSRFFIGDACDGIYSSTLRIMTGHGLLEERVVGRGRVWGLRPEALIARRDVRTFQCERCKHALFVCGDEAAWWEGAPCMRFRCRGYYRETRSTGDYYGKLYRSGDINRIFAEEHTGLLNRDKREDLERRFKAQGEDRAAWDPNLLSCTPTLEMGIDVGDLSATALCGVPPSPANYVQRTGRAGRLEGNAVHIVAVHAQPHDLYFFASPEEMIHGRIDPPGVFLDASAVLARQFIAYCFDRWVETGVPERAIPKGLGAVLNNLETPSPTKFPHNLIAFIRARETELVEGFLEMFAEGEVSPGTRERIRQFVKGEGEWSSSPTMRILEGLTARNEDRKSLRRKVRALHEKIRRMNAEPAKGLDFERDLRDVQREKEGLQAVLKEMKDRDVFNFFTDEGLLPNYAFPESGVLLRSIIYRRRDESREPGPRFVAWTEEYRRLAAGAIAELAPSGTFYAGGRKVVIDQVDVAVSEPRDWRLCDECSYAELIGMGSGEQTCPRCGSVLWTDEGRKRKMVKLTQVFATSSDRDSRLGDDAEDRESSFFNQSMLADFDERHIEGGYTLENEDIAFGFDFIRKADFREINFGEQTFDGDFVRIAGVETPRKGFTICRACGKVQDGRSAPSHAWTCSARDKDAQSNFTDCVYLFREFSSEALRILAPVTSLSEGGPKLESFVAAIHLGLKKFFRGRIDHLRTTIHETPIPDSTYRKKSLILYDTVPGGTGYLKQLNRPDGGIMDVLEAALSTMNQCACNGDLRKDGCYACILRHRRRGRKGRVSRSVAVQLLTPLVTHRDKLVRVSSIGRIDMNPIFGSELEAAFIGALKTAKTNNDVARVVKELVNHKPGYLLTLDKRVYSIEPQVPLGTDDLVDVRSTADFVIRSCRAGDDFRPVAVFTDGFAYHKDRIGRDMAQRFALVNGANNLTWSLTWKDVEQGFVGKGRDFKDFCGSDKGASGRGLGRLLDACNAARFQDILTRSSFDWLISYLVDPRPEEWRAAAFCVAVKFIDPKCTTERARERVEEELLKIVPPWVWEHVRGEKEGRLYGMYAHAPEGADEYLKLFVAADSKAVARTSPPDASVVCVIDDSPACRDRKEFQPVWNGFLRLYNLMQFLPGARFMSKTGIEKGLWDSAPEAPVSRGDGAADAAGNEWVACYGDVAPRLHPLLQGIQESGGPPPEPGYELADDRGVIIATAELAWPGARFAVLRDDETQFAELFEKAGWKTMNLEDALASPEGFSPGRGNAAEIP
jgi:DEAD/DEAH box helicase domain-containing protein